MIMQSNIEKQKELRNAAIRSDIDKVNEDYLTDDKCIQLFIYLCEWEGT